MTPPSRLAIGPVCSATAALLTVLVVTAGHYGYHRDELYFRLLPPALGYVDQPPLTPWLARTMVGLHDSVGVLRLPAAVLAAASVVVLALVVAEVGGSRLAQGLAAWGYAFSAMTLSFGHVLLTASLDLVVWPTVILFVTRAVLRAQPRWWWLAGLVIGLSTYNKWLVIMLVLALVGGLLIAGPRRVLLSRPVLTGAGLAVVVALPNLAWQLTHGLPQREMGQGLSAENAAEVRVTALALLPVMVGPLLFPVVVAGFVMLLRPAWRPVRFLAPALLLAIGSTVAAGSQFYYAYGVLVVVFAIGCIGLAGFSRGRGRHILVGGVLAGHVATNLVINLPVLPVRTLAQTVIPDLNSGVADQVGWPAYVAQIDGVVERARSIDPGAVVLTSNYGEAGALSRYSRLADLVVVSGHNALWDVGPPPASTVTVVVVGGQLERVQRLFGRCTVETRLSNGVGVETEEEGQPVAVCVDPTAPWPDLWPTFRHLS